MNKIAPDPVFRSFDFLGTAIEHDLLMISCNTREFQRVPGLQVEDWVAT